MHKCLQISLLMLSFSSILCDNNDLDLIKTGKDKPIQQESLNDDEQGSSEDFAKFEKRQADFWEEIEKAMAEIDAKYDKIDAEIELKTQEANRHNQ